LPLGSFSCYLDLKLLITVVRTGHTTRLIRQHRPDDGPFMLRKLIPHDFNLPVWRHCIGRRAAATGLTSSKFSATSRALVHAAPSSGPTSLSGQGYVERHLEASVPAQLVPVPQRASRARQVNGAPDGRGLLKSPSPVFGAPEIKCVGGTVRVIFSAILVMANTPRL
jgi:hypothetical protein